MIRSGRLAALPGIRHGLTTRDDGSVGPHSDPDARARRARSAVLLGCAAARLVAPHQVHGARVAVVDGRHAGCAPLPETDGLATTERGLVLLVQGADCPLLLLADADAPALAVVHSGWRGTVAGIAGVAVEALVTLGARRERLVAALFPGIAPCCFEVSDDVRDAFRESHGHAADAWFAAGARPGKWQLDLHAAIAATLAAAGVSAERQDRVPGCTACSGTLWSHRASRGGPERHGLFAALTS